MIDTLNMTLGSEDVGNVDLFSQTPCYFDDNPTEHRYPLPNGGDDIVLGGHVGSLNISVSRYGVKVKDSSFCKWLLGDNFKTLTRGDIKRGIEKLSDTLHLDFNKAKVNRLDIGQNLVVRYPVENYLRHLGLLKWTNRLEQPKGLYYKGQKLQLCFYDKVKEQRREGCKIPQLYEGRHVLRYEIRFIHKLPEVLNVAAVKGATLYDEAFYISLVQMWHDYYKDIKKINDIDLNFGIMTTRRELYRIGLLALVEQSGGQIEFIEKINEAAKRGDLTKKQAYDLRDAVNNACKVKGDIVKPNTTIEELSKKIDEATRFYR